MKEENKSLRKSNKKLYQVWSGMKYRCNTETCPRYHDYGGRGIKVCEDWNKSYESFHHWAINNGYREDLTLDRINNDENYSPENCRWVDRKTQQNNRSYCHNIIIDGIHKTAYEWCEEFNLNYYTFLNRVNTLGWDEIKALKTPVKIRKNPSGYSDMNEVLKSIKNKKRNNK